MCDQGTLGLFLWVVVSSTELNVVFDRLSCPTMLERAKAAWTLHENGPGERDAGDDKSDKNTREQSSFTLLDILTTVACLRHIATLCVALVNSTLFSVAF